MADSVTERIGEILRENRVVLFMKGTPLLPMCGFSAAVVQVLQQIGEPFETVDVLENPEIREGIKTYSNWPTIPQLYVDGAFVGGCDIVRDMHRRGELEPVLRGGAAESR